MRRHQGRLRLCGQPQGLCVAELRCGNSGGVRKGILGLLGAFWYVVVLHSQSSIQVD